VHNNSLKAWIKAKKERKERKGKNPRTLSSTGSSRQRKKSPNGLSTRLPKTKQKELKHTPLKRVNKNANRNQKFYREAWKAKPHFCEECNIYLGEILRSEFISHIIAKGSNSFLRSDLRNANVLCFNHHTQWETGDRKSMRIFEKNQFVIETLKRKYYQR
jgi:hypothetical protein